MINYKKILAIIPARSGSKGLPKKNILPILGKPLIAWSINHAKESKYIDHCIVSTDSQEISDVVTKYNGNLGSLRPESLSSDDASTSSVVKYVINSLSTNYDIVILLQPTSPLRIASDIDNALELMIKEKVSSIVSVTKTNHPPEWTFKLNLNNKINNPGKLKNIKRRQAYNPSYQLNGAIYISKIKDFLNDELFIRNDTLAFIMPKNKSIDIDDLYDFSIAEKLLKDRLDE